MFAIDESLIIKPAPREKPKPAHRCLKYEVSKAIHSGLFFALQNRGSAYVSSILM